MPDDSIVTCANCGRNASVSFSYCLRYGWPKCCGYTMRLSVSPDLGSVDAAVRSLVRTRSDA